jgi:hypothetical protein
MNDAPDAADPTREGRDRPPHQSNGIYQFATKRSTGAFESNCKRTPTFEAGPRIGLHQIRGPFRRDICGFEETRFAVRTSVARPIEALRAEQSAGYGFKLGGAVSSQIGLGATAFSLRRYVVSSSLTGEIAYP